MHIRRVRNDEAAIGRYLTECWQPYHEELSEKRDGHSLVEHARAEAIEFHTDRLDSPAERLWVALDDVDDPTVPLSETTATFAGFVRTRLAPAPQQFDWADRVEIEDCWVRDAYRGSGVADELLDRAAVQAREGGCGDLTLTVGVDNGRALEYFEKRGFEPQGYGMRVPLREVELDPEGIGRSRSSPQFRRLRAREAVVRRFVDECWVPFWRDMGEAVGEQHLDSNLDTDALVDELLDAYDDPDRRCWVALDDGDDLRDPLDETDGVFAGWINAGLEPTSPFLEDPNRLFVGNLYAGPDYRGTGLADRLVARAMQYAREEGTGEFSLGVEAGNDRAMAYYDKLGFEPFETRLSLPVDMLEEPLAPASGRRS